MEASLSEPAAQEAPQDGEKGDEKAAGAESLGHPNEKPMGSIYLVLSKDSEGWLPRKRVNARSSRAAIASVLEELQEQDRAGEYVAVPDRSWRPLKVSVEHQTKLKYE